jgi:hypothetical protein
MLLGDAAVATVDPIMAWLQLIMQTGGLGLAFYMVAVLAPRLLKEAREERASRDGWMQTMLDKNEAGSEKRTKMLARSFKRSAAKIEAVVGTACHANRIPLSEKNKENHP